MPQSATNQPRQMFSFTLRLPGVSELSPDVLDRLFVSGCDDALIGQRNGVTFADFDRESETLEAAIASAIEDVRRAGFSAVPES